MKGNDFTLEEARAVAMLVGEERWFEPCGVCGGKGEAKTIMGRKTCPSCLGLKALMGRETRKALGINEARYWHGTGY